MGDGFPSVGLVRAKEGRSGYSRDKDSRCECENLFSLLVS